jgi:hypothetical protein
MFYSKLESLKVQQKQAESRFGWACLEIEILKHYLNNLYFLYTRGLILESEIEKLKNKYTQEIKSLELDLYSLDY